ncbi:hypothetical protein [Streptosporangium sp. NPDC002524]|uniref:hypothetical protein n=1 Tax=Streptosporangium sp. NPDC002524 TaxID=3154537 RepID=UPI0033216E1C
MRWTLETADSPARVLLPALITLTDYATRVADLLYAVASVENRPARAVYTDMALIDADTQRVIVRTNAPPGTVAVADGLTTTAGINHLLLSAATSEALGENRFVLPGKKPKRARDLLAQALLEPGSEVFTIRIPLSPISGQLPLRHMSLPEPPFGRRVSQLLYRAAWAAHDAAARSLATQDLNGFAAGVNSGVTADLCAALAALGSTARDGFAVRFGWASKWSIPQTYNRPTITFGRALLPVLTEAADFLRMRNTAHHAHATVTGPVVALRQATQNSGGTVTILAGPGSSSDLLDRRVTVHLSEDRYRQAIRAHLLTESVTFDGEVTQQGNALVMSEPNPR